MQTAAITAPPQIIGQPQNRVVAPGEAASFFVVAADTRALAYKWGFNGVPLGGSATNDAVLLQNISTNNEGEYRVVLTNPSGSVTSAPAMLWFDSDADGMGDSWELSYFGNLTNTASASFDGDSVSNVQEFLDNTNPTNSASALFRLTSFSDGGSVIVLPNLPSYTNGEIVTLTAAASSNETFHAWLGDIVTRSNPVTLVMTNNKTVFARFTPVSFLWTNLAGGDWDVGANWTPNLAPGSNDTAIIVASATVTLNTSADCADVTLGVPSSSPTLTGSGTLKVRGTMSWTSGSMSGSGRTIIEPGATLRLDNPGPILLGSRILENGGTVLWTGAGIIVVGGGGVITNRAGALFHVQNAAGLGGFGANGRLDNAGTFRKSVNTGPTTFASGMSLNNSGIVEIQTGTLSLGGGGTHSGSFDVPSSTGLILSGGTHAAGGSSSIAGAGQLLVSGGTANLAGRVNVSGSNTFSGGTANFTGNTICTNNTVTFANGGTANFSGTGLVSPAVLNLINGELGGTGTVTVLNALNWTGGTMSGSGRTIIPMGATLTLANPSGGVGALLNTRTLENGGTVLWTGTGSIAMNLGAVMTNRAGALFHVQNAASFVANAGVGRIDNAGTALILAGGTHTANASSSLTGAGQLAVSGGTANLAGLVNVSGSHTFSGGSTANFTGNTICTNNTLTFSNGGTANFSSTGLVSPAVVNLSNGTLDGTSTVTVNTAMNWTAGTMSGSGRTIIPMGATLTIANPSGVGALLNTRMLENGGTVLWTGTGSIAMNLGAVITNRAGALFHIQNAATLVANAGIGRFDNAGTFRKSANAGTTTIGNGIGFNNSGTVDIRSGILAANSSYTSTSNALLNCALGGTTAGTNYGQLRVAATVTLNGALSVDLINGFLPTTNDLFTVLTAGTRNGTFGNFSYPSNEVTMQLSNTPSSVVVRVTDVFSVPQPAPVPAGLISWWGAEGNALDNVGTNHGVLTNGAAFATGQVGQTFALDGADDHVQVPDSASLMPVSVTIEAWVKFFATNGSRIILVKPLGSGTFDSYGLALQDGAVLAAVADNSGFGPFLTGPANTAERCGVKSLDSGNEWLPGRLSGREPGQWHGEFNGHATAHRSGEPFPRVQPLGPFTSGRDRCRGGTWLQTENAFPKRRRTAALQTLAEFR